MKILQQRYCQWDSLSIFVCYLFFLYKFLSKISKIVIFPVLVQANFILIWCNIWRFGVIFVFRTQKTDFTRKKRFRKSWHFRGKLRYLSTEASNKKTDARIGFSGPRNIIKWHFWEKIFWRILTKNAMPASNASSANKTIGLHSKSLYFASVMPKFF